MKYWTMENWLTDSSERLVTYLKVVLLLALNGFYIFLLKALLSIILPKPSENFNVCFKNYSQCLND